MLEGKLGKWRVVLSAWEDSCGGFGVGVWRDDVSKNGLVTKAGSGVVWSFALGPFMLVLGHG